MDLKGQRSEIGAWKSTAGLSVLRDGDLEPEVQAERIWAFFTLRVLWLP